MVRFGGNGENEECEEGSRREGGNQVGLKVKINRWLLMNKSEMNQ